MRTAAYALASSLVAAGICAGWASAALAQAESGPVAALGRIEPENGIIHISPPLTPQSISGSVVAELLVKPGDDVEAGQLLAVMETAALAEAHLAEAEAEHRLAERRRDSSQSAAEEVCVRARVAQSEADRRAALLEKGVAGEEEAESSAATTEVGAAEAAVALSATHIVRRQAELQRSLIRAPRAGRIVGIHTWPGELASFQGLLEMAAVDSMYAIAEVYETDIGRVRVGQRATVSSDALNQELTGTVEKIHQKVGKMDQIGTDPAARKDARIVEVEIRLDQPELVESLSYLQVEVLIKP